MILVNDCDGICVRVKVLSQIFKKCEESHNLNLESKLRGEGA